MNVDQTVNNDVYKLRTLRQLSEMFGGATTTPAVGGWVSASGALVVEHVDIVYSFCTSEQLTEKIDDIIKICQDLKKDMGQEAITLEVNGGVKFI